MIIGQSVTGSAIPGEDSFETYCQANRGITDGSSHRIAMKQKQHTLQTAHIL